ncbi:B-cell linker protein isoform X3 [Colossoma macropomum]|uniref:B-cell linker protein isoform X3 n=1 Tax=Colossoma macropomum TaxID=42526 RepID=UPI0018650DEE|nr:B-cell linker protein isoform X3 [Colossoma macropomum]
MQIGRAWQRAESCHTHSHHTHSRRTLVDLHPSLAQVPDEPKRTMSFFEKLKNLHSGPPAPPKRIDTNTAYGWSEDEFGEEEGDTYEAPPCERPTIKVQRQPVEENVYLGYPERPHPVIPQRQAAPPPRPAKITPKMRPPEPPTDQEEFYIDPNNRKYVYLDPNEGQSGREPPHDVYLEPTPARPPIPRGGVRMVLPPKTIGRDPPPPIIKPPVPRAKSNSLISSDSVKPVPPPEMRSLTFPTKAPPPTPNNKPPLPIGLKEPKPSPPPPPSVDSTVPVMPPGGQEAGLQNREWFAGICGRKTAEDALLKVKKDGSFLVRCSTAQNAQQPYTLVVLFNQKVYNIPVRFLKDSSSYALGKEGKKNEELFSSLQEMISHHKDNPLLLIDSKSQAKNTTYLTHPVHP